MPLLDEMRHALRMKPVFWLLGLAWGDPWMKFESGQPAWSGYPRTCPNGHPRPPITSEVVMGLLEQQREALEGCAGEHFMLKHTAQCASLRDALGRKRLPLEQSSCVRNLFVTGQEGSGTHFVAAFLRNMGMGEEESGAPSARSCRKQTCGGGVSHEFNGDASIYVAWGARSPVALRPTVRGGDFALEDRWIANASGTFSGEQGHGFGQLMWNARCRFRVVVHLVRHPLRQINSVMGLEDSLKNGCAVCWDVRAPAVRPHPRSPLPPLCPRAKP